MVDVTDNERAAALYPNTTISVMSQLAPQLNAQYWVTKEAQQNTAAIILYLLVNNAFPLGERFGIIDASGIIRRGWSASQFKAFGTAMADYVAGVELARARIFVGASQVSFPSPKITIP